MFVGGVRALLRALCGILFLDARKTFSANVAKDSAPARLSLSSTTECIPTGVQDVEAISFMHTASKATLQYQIHAAYVVVVWGPAG